MPDIAMCQDGECPSRKLCFRYMAIADGDYQDWGMFQCPPGKRVCGAFWPIAGRRIDESKKEMGT